MNLAANQWYYVVATYTTGTQALWINGVKYSTSVNFTPDWGQNDLRLGAPSAADTGFLDGKIGGYVALLEANPSDAYVRASYKDFLLGTLVVFNTPESY